MSSSVSCSEEADTFVEVAPEGEGARCFKISRAVLKGPYGSVTLKNALEDMGDDCGVWPLPGVYARELEIAIEFMVYRTKNAVPIIPDSQKERQAYAVKELDEWETKFLPPVDIDHGKGFFALLAAAKFLDIQALHQVLMKKQAQFITCHTEDEIRDTFGIKNDFTPEEMAANKKESARIVGLRQKIVGIEIAPDLGTDNAPPS